MSNPIPRTWKDGTPRPVEKCDYCGTERVGYGGTQCVDGGMFQPVRRRRRK